MAAHELSVNISKLIEQIDETSPSVCGTVSVVEEESAVSDKSFGRKKQLYETAVSSLS